MRQRTRRAVYTAVVLPCIAALLARAATRRAWAAMAKSPRGVEAVDWRSILANARETSGHQRLGLRSQAESPGMPIALADAPGVAERS
jgi:hypothetical protein